MSFSHPQPIPGARPPEFPPTLETIASEVDANPDGDIFGGWLLAQMDLAGGTHAYAVAANRVVTAGVRDLSFLKPIFVGDRLAFFTRIDRVGRTSISVHIAVWASRKNTENIEMVGEGLYTFVSVDGQLRPKPLQTTAA